MIENKKLALIRILQILEKNTDAEHSVTQDEIVEILARDYGIEIERKAVGRDVAALAKAEFDIEVGRGGTKLIGRTFDETELRLLIDSVIASKHISDAQSKKLIDNLCSLSSKYFKAHINHVFSIGDWTKTDNKNLFYNIHVIDEAIDEKKVIEYDYNKYGTDKKMHKSSTQKMTPYQLFQHNQHYYLMGYSAHWEHMSFHRVDKITNIKKTDEKPMPLRKVKGYENGINYKELSTARPYMFADKPEEITFYADETIADTVIDWFGKDVKFLNDGDRLRVIVKSSPTAMLYWALQYADAIEIIRPIELRERIKNTLKEALEKYRD